MGDSLTMMIERAQNSNRIVDAIPLSFLPVRESAIRAGQKSVCIILKPTGRDLTKKGLVFVCQDDLSTQSSTIATPHSS